MSQPDDDLGRKRGEISPDERDAIRQRASALGDRIESAKVKVAPQVTGVSRGDSYGQAFKMATELVAGVVVGGGIGWVLDSALGTRPWLLIVFFFLGFAAGLLNLVRAAQRLQRGAEAQQRAAPALKDDDLDDR
jgi:ATP synthase protein I